MGAARLGGPKVAPRIAPLLRDSSWMLRSGALRALAALGDASTGPQVLPLLKDPSLAVRLEAVAATRRLRPPGAAQALLGVLGSGDNYHGGKALWVPGRALAALTALHATEAASSLRPLLDHMGDPDLLLETIDALERLTGRRLKPGAPLSVRVREWKLALSR
jgi:HEAT repeat protein